MGVRWHVQDCNSSTYFYPVWFASMCEHRRFMTPSVLAIEIQPMLMLPIKGVVLVIRVRFCLHGPTVEVCSELWVQKSLPHLLVFPGCCLPHHFQLFLYLPGEAKRGEKTRKSVSQVQYDGETIKEIKIHKFWKCPLIKKKEKIPITSRWQTWT